MSTLKRAIAIAAQAHAGQVDEAGSPYLGHSLRVMRRLKGKEARIVGVLHDVIENSCWTLDRLSDEGFSYDVIEALDALTRRKEEHHGAFLRRAAANPIARQVKQADLEDNCEALRIAELSERLFGHGPNLGQAPGSVPRDDRMWGHSEQAA
jgi:(p)ppGpp synthase/HD superfamily hydrolase